MSHSAVTFTLGSFSTSPSTKNPRLPVPIMPVRTGSSADALPSNIASPDAATDAFTKSRRCMTTSRLLEQLRREFVQVIAPVDPGVRAGALLEHRAESVLLQ